MAEYSTQVALVGAGPIGIEMAVALKKAGIDYLHFEKKQIAHTISWFPPMMRFFSSPDRIMISGVPIPRIDESKASREEYMAYLRGIVLQHGLQVRSYEKVLSVRAEDDGFVLETENVEGRHQIRARNCIMAIGDMHRPHKVNVPGEELKHVRHYFGEPHEYFQRRILVVGGKNSAVEAALRCYHCGSEVAISHRDAGFDGKGVKYWLLPELEGRISRGEIVDYPETELVEIQPGKVFLQRKGDKRAIQVRADFVLLMVGYEADLTLLVEAGVRLEGEEQAPVFDADTMESNVPGLYVAGTAVAGCQQSYKVFIENCHVHVDRILAHLQGQPAPAGPARQFLPES